jgi:uncharacterized protein (DUF849 family)
MWMGGGMIKIHLRAVGNSALCDEKIKEPLTHRIREATCPACIDMTKTKIPK